MSTRLQPYPEVWNSLKNCYARPHLIPRFEIHVPGSERSGSVVNRVLDGLPAYVAQTKLSKISWISRYCGSGVVVVRLLCTSRSRRLDLTILITSNCHRFASAKLHPTFTANLVTHFYIIAPTRSCLFFIQVGGGPN